MSSLSQEQLHEREILALAIKTVTKTEPRYWADFIHRNVAQYQEMGKDQDTIINWLRDELSYHKIVVITGGNNFSWKNPTVKLSQKQIETIVSWIRVMLYSGGRFTEYEKEEDDAILKKMIYPSFVETLEEVLETEVLAITEDYSDLSVDFIHQNVIQSDDQGFSPDQIVDRLGLELSSKVFKIHTTVKNVDGEKIEFVKLSSREIRQIVVWIRVRLYNRGWFTEDKKLADLAAPHKAEEE